MGRLRSISRSIWGPELLRMRQLYLTKVRPIIAYGCGAWFLRGSEVKWSLSNLMMQRLEWLQYECLVHIAGAYKRIPGQYLLKELYIEPLEIYLDRCALAFVARNRAPGPDTLIQDLRQSMSPQRHKWALLHQHPYHVLDRNAQKLQEVAQKRWTQREAAFRPGKKAAPKISGKPTGLAKTINACAREAAEYSADEHWKAWRNERQSSKGHDQPVLWSTWGKENLSRYENMPRAQSSLLLQCRTGVGGLRTYLYRLKVRLSIRQMTSCAAD